MQRVAFLITMQLISAAMCLCQIKIPLVDVSAAGSPVRISGTLLFQDNPSTALRYTYLIDGSETNVSNKRIVLTIIHISATNFGPPGLDDTIAVDRFFGSNDLNPGGVEVIFRAPLMFGPAVSAESAPPETGPAASSSATAELIFVQFADGSTWGDLDVGRQQLSVRTKTLRELHRLGQILDEQGQLGLKNELLQVNQFQFPAIDTLKNRCTDKTAFCLTNGLRSMLKEAELHEIETKAGSPSERAALP